MATLVRDTAGMTKTCSVCGVDKPLDQYSFRNPRTDKRVASCKACRSAYATKRYRENETYRERAKARGRGEHVEPRVPRTIDERFDDFLIPEPNTGCLIFMGTIVRGYGHFHVATGESPVKAHRFAYARAFGPIAPGLEVHHKCRNRLCCEPSHLQAVTPEEHAAIHAKEDDSAAI